MKQRIIAVVGPDMCGKTEIAKELAKKLKLPYFKAASEHETYLRHPDRFIQQLRYSDVRLTDFLKQTGYSVIMDRAWPCERVYASVLDRETDEAVLRKIDDEMSYLGAKIVVCHRSSYDGIVDDIDSKLDSRMLEKIDNAYKGFTIWTKCSTLLLNVDDEDLDREIADILGWLE